MQKWLIKNAIAFTALGLAALGYMIIGFFKM